MCKVNVVNFLSVLLNETRNEQFFNITRNLGHQLGIIHRKWKTVGFITEETFCFYFVLRGVSTHYFFVLSRSLHKDFKVV